MADGSSEVSKYDILVDYCFISKIYGTLDSNESYIGNKINLCIDDVNYEFNIKGIWTGAWNDNPDIYFSSEFLDEAIIYYDVKDAMSCVKISCGNDLKVLENYTCDNYELINPYSDDMNSCADFYLSLKKIGIGLFVIGILLYMTITIFLNTMFIKNSKRTIAILKRYGCKNSYICKLLLIDNLTIYITTTIIAIISYIAYYILLNKDVIYNTITTKFVMPLNIWIVFLLIVLSIELLSLFYNIRLIKKKENKILLKSY